MKKKREELKFIYIRAKGKFREQYGRTKAQDVGLNRKFFQKEIVKVRAGRWKVAVE